jgi:cytochrome c-type biogenesis protein CcmH/NrfF
MKSYFRRVNIIAIAIAIAAISCIPAHAQQDTTAESHQGTGTPDSTAAAAEATLDPALRARARAIKLELRCPVCEGSSIEESPSQQASEMKAIVDEQLTAGKSEEEIKDYFVSKYGEWILLDPPAHGINLLMYVLPLVLAIAGAFFVYRTAKKWTQA